VMLEILRAIAALRWCAMPPGYDLRRRDHEYSACGLWCGMSCG